MKKTITRRVIAVGSILFGLVWCVICGVHVVGLLSGGEIGWEYILPVVSASPGVLYLVCGIRFLKDFQEGSMRVIVGFTLLLIVLTGIEYFNGGSTEVLSERARRSVLLFCGGVLAVVLHVRVVRFLICYFTGEKRTLKSLVSRGVRLLLAIQLFSALSALMDPYEKGYLDQETASRSSDLVIWFLSVPLIVAVLAYSWVGKWLSSGGPSTVEPLPRCDPRE